MNLVNTISIEALQVLDAIDKRGSFAAAAEQLNKVPSALSYIIQKLEEQLGVTIFVKQGRRSVLTPAGSHLLVEGRKVLTAIEQISNQTKTIANGWEPKINIAVDSILDIRSVYQKLSVFLNEHPDVEIAISEEVMKGGWEALINDKVDLLIGAPNPTPNHQGISSRLYQSLDNILVASPKHPLVRSNKEITAELLKSYRTVVVRDSVKFDIARSTNLIENSKHFYVQSIEQKIKAIEENLGIGFLPKQRIKNLINNKKLIQLQHQLDVTNLELQIAWKTANRGKGLAKLREIFLND